MSDLLVVGLGNPGDRYAHTRHNVGIDALEILVARHGGALRPDKRSSSSSAALHVAGRRVHAVFPGTFMNDSGRPLSALVRRSGIEDWSDLVVLHDELDLEPGRVKVKVGGGLAGHNGLRSVTQHLGTQDYARVRIGVGKSPWGPGRGADWVLSKVPAGEREELDAACATAADAVALIAEVGLDAAMAQVNRAG